MIFLCKQVNSFKQKVGEEHLDRRSVCLKEVDEVTFHNWMRNSYVHSLVVPINCD